MSGDMSGGMSGDIRGDISGDIRGDISGDIRGDMNRGMSGGMSGNKGGLQSWYKGCIFDLDGTLVNSIHALTHCTNLALGTFSLGPVTEERMKKIVGDGYRMQMRRSLLACGDAKLQNLDAILPVYLDIFSENCLYQVEAYEGIRELLEYLKGRGRKIAVVSNKPEAQAVDTVEAIFGKGYFDRIVGEKEGIPKKPDPAGALLAARELGVRPEECLYFGDTNTDMKTGRSAGMDTVGVLWGFRGREELEPFAPKYLIGRPWEMVEILERDSSL